jgi:hypothetical protein
MGPEKPQDELLDTLFGIEILVHLFIRVKALILVVTWLSFYRDFLLSITFYHCCSGGPAPRTRISHHSYANKHRMNRMIS